MNAPRLVVEFDREDDKRWIAEVLGIPGALVYGDSREEALGRVQALALRILADRALHDQCGSGR